VRFPTAPDLKKKIQKFRKFGNLSKTIVKPTINETSIEGGVPNPEETPQQKPCNG